MQDGGRQRLLADDRRRHLMHQVISAAGIKKRASPYEQSLQSVEAELPVGSNFNCVRRAYKHCSKVSWFPTSPL